MKFSPMVLFMLLPRLVLAQNAVIIPQPVSFTKTSGQFKLNGNTIIGMNDNSLLPVANYFQNELQRSNAIAVAVDPNEEAALIDLQIVKNTQVNGAYSLSINSNKITISAQGNEGVFYGLVSLLQLIRAQPAAPAISLPACQITDAPRYQWRGFMLDESRHFFGMGKVKQLLDWMAFYKLNKFHWHLTDADGWRVQINQFPALSAIGAIGKHTDPTAPAKFYTEAQIREIVAYAQDRFISIIPEIDMPGHATAANRAYPEFSGGSYLKYKNFTFDPVNEQTYSFLTNILKEVNAVFPAQMIHLGGDEVDLGMQAWAGRSAISELMAKNKFTSLTDVEHYFFKRMADSVIKLRDKVLCWDEAAATDLQPDKTIVFWWRQNFNSHLELALQKKYEVILCPRLPLYLDFVQDKNHVSGRKWNGEFFNRLADIYNFPDMVLPAGELQPAQILGIQANLWTESIASEKRLDFMTFPRMAALAESAWTEQAQKDEASFNERLKLQFAIYDKAGIYYYNPFDPSAHPEVTDFATRFEKHAKKGRHHRNMHLAKLVHQTKKRDQSKKGIDKLHPPKKKHPST